MNHRQMVNRDLFFFNFNGYSGKFYFNDDRTPMLIPEQDFKIEYSYTPGLWTSRVAGAWANLGRNIEAFTITTPDGTKYYFGFHQAPVSPPYFDPVDVSSTFMQGDGIETAMSQAITSWYLNKIVSPDGNFVIDLKYERDKYAVYTFSNPPVFTGSNNPYRYEYTLVKNLITESRLSQITTSTEKVDFTKGIIRKDLSRWASGFDQNLTDVLNESTAALGSIVINDIDGNCFKKFNFSYDYFVDNSPVIQNFSNIVSDKKRLKLNSLQEQSCDGTTTIPPYFFEYFTEQVSRKLSFSRDHWGFNNGVTANTKLYPALTDNSGSVNTAFNIGTAIRETQWPAMRGGTLSKIKYPTGGYTQFDFEPNKFWVVENNVNLEKYVGGLRIKTITNYEPVSNSSTVTNYSYNGSNNLSSGFLFGVPTYIQVVRNDLLQKTYGMPSAFHFGCTDAGQSAGTIAWRPYVYSDNTIRPMESTQGYHIGYGEVKVSQTGNGSTVYRFTVPQIYSSDPTKRKIAITYTDNPFNLRRLDP